MSRIGTDLNAHVAELRTSSLADAGPFSLVACNALTMKVGGGGRVVSTDVVMGTGVSHDGHREPLGMQVATSDPRRAWNMLFAELVARGLTGVKLITSDAHADLVEAMRANFTGTSWQRCCTHYAANLMSVWP